MRRYRPPTVTAACVTRAMHATRQQGSVCDAESLIGSVVTNLIGGITRVVCTYKLCQTVMCVESVTNGVTCIHTNYLDFLLHPHIRILPQAGGARVVEIVLGEEYAIPSCTGLCGNVPTSDPTGASICWVRRPNAGSISDK